MFESYSNIFFIILALAVFIGRTIVQARKKPEPPGPRIPVHFEDGDAERETRTEDALRRYASSRGASDHIKKAAVPLRETPVKRSALLDKPSQSVKTPSSAAAAASPGSPPAASPAGSLNAGPLSGGRQTAFNLGHLSPLKQAVAMAEILGPPKGLL